MALQLDLAQTWHLHVRDQARGLMLVPAGWGTIGTVFPPERQRSRSSPRPPDVLAVGAVFGRPGPPAPLRTGAPPHGWLRLRLER
jgi:hypothetical protein